MSYMQLTVNHVKCGGCARTIQDRLLKINAVEMVEVDVTTGMVKITGDEDLQRNLVLSELKHMGYSPVGQGGSLDRAKSYLSCLKGRLK